MLKKLAKPTILFVLMMGILRLNSAFADVSDLQPKEQFDVYVGQLDDYLADPYSSEGYDINSICNSLKKAYGYDGDKGIAFYAYAMVIRDIDLAKWDDVYENLTIIENNPSFQEYVSSEEFLNSHSQIRSVDVLKAYCNGRVAEANGQWQNAIDSYWPAVCVGFYDSYSRWQSASDNLEQQKEDDYNYGLDLYYNQNALNEAASVFQSLGTYKESEALYNEIIGIINENNQADKAAIYQTGLAQLGNKEFEAAVNTFTSLGDYDDSAAKAEEARSLLQFETAYQTGLQQFEQGMYWDAAATFQTIMDYENSSDMYQQSLNGIADEQTRQSIENPKEWLVGHWTMTERRKDANDDLIQFGFDILSVSEDGKMKLRWGEEIDGYWDEVHRTMTIFDTHVYILDHRMLGGGNENYSGLAIKDNTINLPTTDSLIGRWVMTERRKNEYNDVITFEINIRSVDGNGKVDIDWGIYPDEIGTWQSDKRTLKVFRDQVYVFHNGTIAGGNRYFSGIAVKVSDIPAEQNNAADAYGLLKSYLEKELANPNSSSEHWITNYLGKCEVANVNEWAYFRKYADKSSQVIKQAPKGTIVYQCFDTIYDYVLCKWDGEYGFIYRDYLSRVG